VRGRILLATSVLAAILVAACTTVVLLLVEPTASKGEAIKTGGLTGGAVVALYALWLNDRRRRTEEARHELESEKVADERFARSVELLARTWSTSGWREGGSAASRRGARGSTASPSSAASRRANPRCSPAPPSWAG
jgi:hypothetical protein